MMVLQQPYAIVVDFKLLESGNKGPNTGSMGCISYSDHKAPSKDSDILVAVILIEMLFQF